MRKLALCMICAALLVSVAEAQETSSVSTLSAAGKLYQKAIAAQKGGDPKAAIQLAGSIVAGYAQDTEWMGKAELLCAELYIELGMLEAAEVTARQVGVLYPGTEFEKNAQALCVKIDELKKELK